jgi:hypothetical protein
MNLQVYECDVIGEFNRKSGKSIVVNPAIYYSGINVDDVKGIAALFNVIPKNN